MNCYVLRIIFLSAKLAKRNKPKLIPSEVLHKVGKSRLSTQLPFTTRMNNTDFTVHHYIKRVLRMVLLLLLTSTLKIIF